MADMPETTSRDTGVSPEPFSPGASSPTTDARYYQQPADLRYKKLMFAYLIILQIFINYDSGAIPPSISGKQCPADDSNCNSGNMEGEFGLSLLAEGLLGSLVYLGFTAACFFAGSVLEHYSPKRVLGAALLVNTAFCLCFSLSTVFVLVLCARFFVGLSQAFVVIYAPVWVDEFAPRSHCTLWMSLVQAGVPLGIMLGYAFAGVLAANTDWGWRPAFYIQTATLGVLSFIWLFVPAKYIDPEGHRRLFRAGSSYPISTATAFSLARISRHTSRGLSHAKAILSQARGVFSSGVWIMTCLALCALYFVVTGTQLWVTAYLQAPPISAGLNAIVIGFSAVSATAPIAGVLTGGWVVDRVGGYQGYMHRAALAASLFGAVSAVCAWLCIFLTNFVAFLVFAWFLLFFGAAVVPAATGILLACVSRQDRPLASALSMLLYNLLGYFAGPFVSGLVASLAGDLRWSFRVIMLWANLALIFMVAAWRIAQRDYDRRQAAGLPSTVLVGEEHVVAEAGNPVEGPDEAPHSSPDEDENEEEELEREMLPNPV